MSLITNLAAGIQKTPLSHAGGARGRQGRRGRHQPAAGSHRGGPVTDDCGTGMTRRCSPPRAPGVTRTRTPRRAPSSTPSSRPSSPATPRPWPTCTTASTRASPSAPPGSAARSAAGSARMNRVLVAQAAAGFAALPARAARRRAAEHRDRLRRAQELAGLRPGHRRDHGRRPASARDPAPAPAADARCWPSPCGTSTSSAGVMVTASPQPRRDNGYKVYLGGVDAGSQIVSPADAEIAAHIRDAADRPRPRAAAVGRLRRPARPRRRVRRRTAAIAGTAAARPQPRVVYTAMHGVGWETSRARSSPRRASTSRSSCRSRPSPTPTSRRWRSPTPRSPARSTSRSRRRGRGRGRARDRERPRRRPARRRHARSAPTAGAGALGQRGRRCCSGGASPSAIRRPTTATAPSPARIVSSPALARGRPPLRPGLRRHPHRLQVDLPRARAAVRLRGGARLPRRPGEGARQGRHLRRRRLPRAGASSRPTGRPSPSTLAEFAERSGRTPRRRSRSASTTSPRSRASWQRCARRRRATDRLASRRPHRRPARRLRRASRRATCCASGSPTDRASSCARAAPSRSSRSTSTPRAPRATRRGAHAPPPRRAVAALDAGMRELLSWLQAARAATTEGQAALVRPGPSGVRGASSAEGHLQLLGELVLVEVVLDHDDVGVGRADRAPRAPAT